MSEKSDTPPRLSLRLIAGLFVYLLYTPLVLLISSERLNWWMAWVYAIVSIVLSLGSRVIMARRHPDLVAERTSFRKAQGIKEWDKKLVPLVAQVGPFFILLTAGLDQRFGWTTGLPLWVSVSALVVAILGFFFSTWALIENQYFSSVVRIQTERGHSVCSSGPYQYIRHPGYAGGLVWFLMTPLILNSLWAYIPTAIVVLLTVLRTALEDNTLLAELPGYLEYAKQTRYRLVPGVW